MKYVGDGVGDRQERRCRALGVKLCDLKFKIWGNRKCLLVLVEQPFIQFRSSYSKQVITTLKIWGVGINDIIGVRKGRLNYDNGVESWIEGWIVDLGL